MGHSGATVGLPGSRAELQAAVVAVAGVDGPVATGLALCDRVPVHSAVRRGGSGAEGKGPQCHPDDQSGEGECPANVHVMGIAVFRRVVTDESPDIDENFVRNRCSTKVAPEISGATSVRSQIGAGQPRWPHVGQAPMPWDRSTFSATRICSAREAWFGMPLPPLARQVLGLNCRPPK